MSKNESILIDLDFSPEWARKPASAQMHAGSDKRPLSKHSSRSGKDFERREKKHPAKPFKRRETPEMPQRGRESGAPTDRFASKESEASREYLPIPVRISFIPERSGLKPVAQWLAGTMKAHSLISIASMFLSKPEYFAVKLESLTTQDNAPETTMYQCGICKIVYLDKEKIVAHLLDKHQDEFYKTEEVSVDPPKGNFLCVAQCRVSGVLLGPPNYHGYNTIMADMQRTRFPHLSMEEYRNQIVIRKEQEIIDQWKNEVCQQIRYTTLKAQEPAVLESRGEVESHFIKHHAPTIIREGTRFIAPGPIMLASSEDRLHKVVYDSWRRKNRFLTQMSVALQPAFRRLGLHFFKNSEKTIFVSAISLKPIDTSQTAGIMRNIMEQTKANPGCGRMELVELVNPGSANDSEKAAEIISQLCWLISRGHIVEYADSKLELAPEKKTATSEKKVPT